MKGKEARQAVARGFSLAWRVPLALALGSQPVGVICQMLGDGTFDVGVQFLLGVSVACVPASGLELWIVSSSSFPAEVCPGEIAGDGKCLGTCQPHGRLSSWLLTLA